MCEFVARTETNQIYFAADLFMCEFVARTKQTRSTLLQTCLCVSLWLAQNKPDLLCYRLAYVGVCGSHKINKIYIATDLFMCEFVARTKQIRSTSLQTCLCVSLWLARNKPDLLCCRLIYVWVCGSYKTTRSTLLQSCLCVSLWLAQNKPDLLCCRLVYVWVCGSHKTNQIYFILCKMLRGSFKICKKGSLVPLWYTNKWLASDRIQYILILLVHLLC